MKSVFFGWFLIKSVVPVDGGYEFDFVDPLKNVTMHGETIQPLPYSENSWIKIKAEATCIDVVDFDEVQTNVTILYLSKQAKDCILEKWQEEKCTEQNTFIVGGVGYC